MSSPRPFDSLPSMLSVTELNRLTRELLEQTFPLLWVKGEISNLRRYDSGHWYFVLKDAGAQARCVMFRHKNQYLDWKPEDGTQVEVRALVTLYEARGEFQLNVEAMRRAGLGALFEAFERLKAKLAGEGLFDAAHKKPLPPFPGRIGIVTSPAAAALRDVLTTLKRRMPATPVVIYPTQVQGEGAGARIVSAIQAAAERNECDVLILCRGGGSIEDLWAFNEEAVARAVFACPIPVVTGVGHETDFTIADFVADARAPTPTAAAELVSPDRADLRHRLEILHGRLSRGMVRGIEARMQHLDHLGKRLVHPGERIRNQAVQLGHLKQRLAQAGGRLLEGRQWRLRELARRLRSNWDGYTGRLGLTLNKVGSHLTHLNPQLVLERGYSLVEGKDGVIVRDSAKTAVGDELRITFARGWAKTEVKDKA
ncbi:MAG: exodeoxyribonuclease VII large subunit [Betaproteobacteria bacterium]|nr:exodeoxyribonuclease VII large subunit [Betaproteobacteria bacterium]